jgi:hypothetical protein
MLAELALKNAGNEMIGALTGRGLAIIRRDAKRTDEDVFLFFIPRGRCGYDHHDMTFVGLYDDLDTAVTIANIGYGISENGWERIKDFSGIDLPLISRAIKEYETGSK